MSEKEVSLPSREIIKIRHILFQNMTYLNNNSIKVILQYIGLNNTLFPKPMSHEQKNANTCKICMELIRPGDRAAIWCFHPFCKGCLSKWYSLKNECPLCKQPFCISCGLNPKEDIKKDTACKCFQRIAHRNARTCNLCGVWAPNHTESECPQFNGGVRHQYVILSYAAPGGRVEFVFDT